MKVQIFPKFAKSHLFPTKTSASSSGLGGGVSCMKIHPYIALKCELMSLSDPEGAWEDEGNRDTKSVVVFPRKLIWNPKKLVVFRSLSFSKGVFSGSMLVWGVYRFFPQLIR